MPYQEFTLPNGLHVILHRDTSVPVVAVNVWYHVGSGNEKVGRTGFAHLFEHLMFEGSKHVPEGSFDTWLEGAGANNNGSTNTDRTNYYIDGPANALELMLFLESDRMGYLLDTMSPERVDGQRDVVKNERRQSYENRPYGMAELELDTLLWPKGHPYSWSTIGSMEDLSAASHQDVQEFFRTYYAPNNASLVIAGDIDLADDQGDGREVVQRRARRQAGAAGGAAGGDAHRGDAQDRDRSRAAAAALPGVADPGADAARRRRARRGRVAADQRQELAALQAAGLRAADRPGRASPTSSRRCSAAPSTCRRRRAPARPSRSCRR